MKWADNPMQRKHSILYPVVGAAFLLLSCSEKQVPSSITTVSLEDYRETLDAKEIFRLFADESCAGKPIHESGCISLKDLVVKYYLLSQ